GKPLAPEKASNTCHTTAPDGKPFASVNADARLEDLRDRTKQHSGCLAGDTAKRGKAPRFPFREDDRKALRAFLSEGLGGPGAPAPGHAARVALERFNCLACHVRDGEGGPTTALVEQLRRFEKADNAEAVLPPPLTGVAHKLRTPWLREVLTGRGRA